MIIMPTHMHIFSFVSPLFLCLFDCAGVKHIPFAASGATTTDTKTDGSWITMDP